MYGSSKNISWEWVHMYLLLMYVVSTWHHIHMGNNNLLLVGIWFKYQYLLSLYCSTQYIICFTHLDTLFLIWHINLYLTSVFATIIIVRIEWIHWHFKRFYKCISIIRIIFSNHDINIRTDWYSLASTSLFIHVRNRRCPGVCRSIKHFTWGKIFVTIILSTNNVYSITKCSSCIILPFLFLPYFRNGWLIKI